MTTLLKRSKGSPAHEAAGRALREAGVGVVEIDDSTDAARALSHELRTPLLATAGWVHLMETGTPDEAGFKRAIGRLHGNIDDQVRTIERYLGTTT